MVNELGWNQVAAMGEGEFNDVLAGGVVEAPVEVEPDCELEEGDEDSVEEMEMPELLEKYQDQEGINNFEMESGVRKFAKILRALDNRYRSLEDFFADNTGATEAVLEWICDRTPEEWKENLRAQIDE